MAKRLQTMRQTKYEQKRAANERAKEIKANIADIEAQLAEAKDILQVIPTQGWEAQQERKEVHKRIVELEAYLKDERQALSELEEGDVDAIVSNLM